MLSRREREVADLVTRGMTNREIAQKLFRSERTVEGHVQQILNKLGFDSRVQIAAWAVEQRSISADPSQVTVGDLIPRTARPPRRPWGLLAAMLALVVVVGSALASALKSQPEPHPGPDRVTVIATGITGSSGGFMAIDSQQAVYITAFGVDPHRIGLDGSVTAVSPNIAASSIVIGPNDVLYVGGNDPRVTVGIWRLQDGVWMRVAGKDDGGSSEDGAQALDALLFPLGLALDDSGDIYYSDQYGSRYVIRKITPDGRVFTVAGSGQAGYSGDDGPATLARLSTPPDKYDDVWRAAGE